LLIGLGLATIAVLSAASAIHVYSTVIEIDGVSHMLSTWRSQAEAGDRLAQYVVGDYYLRRGDGSEDIPSGVSWLRKSANQSEPRAELQLGLAYRTGTGVEQNDVEAVRWLRFAAQQGNVEAAYNLGYIYETGVRISPHDPLWSQVTASAPSPKAPEPGDERKVKVRNPLEAARWYRIAVDRGHAGAMLNLGTMYRDGRGVEKNGLEAMHLLQRAAAGLGIKSDPIPSMAAMNLAVSYQKGDIVGQDYAAAARWAEAALGSPGLQPIVEVAAAKLLAGLYADGHGVPRDEEKARALHARAAARWQEMRRSQALQH
jgi:hypothetical protein